MCRIFGFRSVKDSGVHQSLVEADNALATQSEEHSDGWGMAYYLHSVPHIIKLSKKALDCSIFKQISSRVSSKALLAHIRLSTVGKIGPLNTHPFQWGKWVFCHNGTIKNFKEKRSDFYEKIKKDWWPFIVGETDSEVLFFHLMTFIDKYHDLEKFDADPRKLQKTLSLYIEEVESIVGPLICESKEPKSSDKNYLTFVLTDGEFMMGFNGGKSILWSTHKNKCPESSQCSFYKPLCEKAPMPGDKVQHFILSSEVLHNENVWNEIPFRGFSFVNSTMEFFSEIAPRK